MPIRYRYTPEDEERLRAGTGEERPKRRALLVGIRYANSEEWPMLEGSFEDVDAYFDLLVGTYGYRQEDIVVMKDEFGVPPELWPTEENLLRELEHLVRDPAHGDQFTFSFSGHSDQQKTTETLDQEEDGQDEVLITCDGKRIVDNELKDILVNPLPAGCSLTAFLDSCHSGTMLDLPHHHCNALYVPWISKGERRTKTMHNMNVRRLARRDTQDWSDLPSFSAALLQNARNESAPAYEPPQSKRRLAINTRLQLHHPRSLPAAVVRGRTGSVSSPIQRCDSPMSRVPCDGWCTADKAGRGMMPTVVSISSCADAQRSWEGPHGTMTKIVCDHLKLHPYSSYRNLMTAVQFKLHANAVKLHEWTMSEKKANKEASAGFDGEMNDFQTPELSSLVKLDMDESIHL